MKFTEDNVYRIEHQILNEQLLCTLMAEDNDNMHRHMIGFIEGVQAMANGMLECLKELK